MSSPEKLISILSVVAYLCAALLIMRSGKRPRFGMVFLLAGILFQGLVLHWRFTSPAGIRIDLPGVISFIAWQSIWCLGLMMYFWRVQTILLLIIPLSALASLGAGWWPIEVRVLKNESPELWLHMLVAALALGMLELAIVQSWVIFWQNRMLRGRQLQFWLWRLPPLERMENSLWFIMWLFFFLLSLVLISSLWFLSSISGQIAVAFSITAWLLVGLLIWGHNRFGWRGSLAAFWMLGGGLMLVMAYWLGHYGHTGIKA